MTTNDNVELVQRFYAAKGDPAIVSQLMASDVVWDLTPGFPGGEIYTGLASVGEDFLAPLAAGFVSFGARPDSFTGSGDRVFVVGHYVGTSTSGVDFTARFVHIWTIADGVITHNYQIADSAVVHQHLQH